MGHKPLPAHRDDLFYRHTVLPAARRIAASIIDDARASTTPVAWVTGNSYMPPARSFTEFEMVWQHRLNESTPERPYAGGQMSEAMWEEIERILTEADVYTACPDYDNSIYAVDSRRWEYIGEDNPAFDEFDMNGEYLPVVRAGVTCPECGKSHKAGSATLAKCATARGLPA
jgi:hypothetical protein